MWTGEVLCQTFEFPALAPSQGWYMFRNDVVWDKCFMNVAPHLCDLITLFSDKELVTIPLLLLLWGSGMSYQFGWERQCLCLFSNDCWKCTCTTVSCLLFIFLLWFIFAYYFVRCCVLCRAPCKCWLLLLLLLSISFVVFNYLFSFSYVFV